MKISNDACLEMHFVPAPNGAKLSVFSMHKQVLLPIEYEIIGDAKHNVLSAWISSFYTAPAAAFSEPIVS